MCMTHMQQERRHVRIYCLEMCKLGRCEKMFDMRGLPAQAETP